MKNIYEKLYSHKKNLGDLSANPRIRVMLDLVNRLNPNNKNILDIGCYDGTFLESIKNRNNRFFGIEASDWGVEQCKGKNIAVRRFFFDDKNAFPYENNFFDIVISGEIIEHVFNTDFFLSEIGRVLKPGGILLVSTPNIASFGRRLLLFFGKNPIIEVSPNEPESSGHIRYFTYKTLKNILEKNGFGVFRSEADVVNFSSSGNYRSETLAKIFPTYGTSIIVLAKNKKPPHR